MTRNPSPEEMELARESGCGFIALVPILAAKGGLAAAAANVAPFVLTRAATNNARRYRRAKAEAKQFARRTV